MDLRRLERAVNLQAVALVTPIGAPFSIRVFGGPSRFGIKQDVVNDITFVETLAGTAYTVEITGIDRVDDTEGSAWGFHVGADARYFFTERVGVGAVVRVSRGEVEIPGLFGDPTDIDVGGIQVGGGLRLRF